MTRTAKRIAGVIIAVVAFLLAALVVQIPAGPKADDLRSQIEKSLPLGSSAEQVAEFVKRVGMEQSAYLERERMINGIVRGVKIGLFAETSLYARFYFDEKGRLQRFTVEEVSTSL